jgi:hypothetical protein
LASGSQRLFRQLQGEQEELQHSQAGSEGEDRRLDGNHFVGVGCLKIKK